MAAPLGNQNGKKARIWAESLKRALARYTGDSVEAGLDRIADRVVKSAIEDPMEEAKDAINEIANRCDGKPAQAVIGGDDDDPPLRVEGIAIRLVKPDGA